MPAERRATMTGPRADVSFVEDNRDGRSGRRCQVTCEENWHRPIGAGETVKNPKGHK